MLSDLQMLYTAVLLTVKLFYVFNQKLHAILYALYIIVIQCTISNLKVGGIFMKFTYTMSYSYTLYNVMHSVFIQLNILINL